MNAQAHKRLGAIVVLMAVAATFAAAISALSHEQTSSMHIEQEPPEEAAGSILPSEAVAADRFWPPEPRTKETWFNISHILVAHREAIFADSPLWLPGAAPNRSRDAARALAQGYLARLRQQPQGFAALASEVSDDVASRPRGGLLGAQSVANLREPLEAVLMELELGEISDVVESPAGFHLFRREPRYAWSGLAASRILIRYEGLRPGPTMRDRRMSRSDALRFAERIRAQLIGSTASFGEVAAELSDAADARQGGDLGVCETAHDASIDPSVWSTVSMLGEGRVSEVLDTRSGWQVLLRTSGATRPTLWAEEILVSHRESLPLAPGLAAPTRSKIEAAALAQQLHGELRRDPEAFAVLRAEHCEVERCLIPLVPWRTGRGTAGFDPVVLPLRIGEVARGVVETVHGFHIVRRLDPKDHVRIRGVPAEVRLVRTVASMVDAPPQNLQPLLGGLGRFRADVVRSLDLHGDLAAKVEDVLDEFRWRIASGDGANIIPMLMRGDAKIQHALGPERFAAYVRFRQAWSERMN